MLTKILWTTLLAFLGWNAFLFVVKPNPGPLHQWQENMKTSEDYLYGASQPQNVIVGSSLAKRLALDSLPDFFNLSFSGLSAYDGLWTIKRKGIYPQRILIETNLLLRPPSEDYRNQSLNFASYYRKKYIPAFREGLQPLSVIFGAVKSRSNFLGIEKGMTKVDSITVRKCLQLSVSAFSQEPDSILLQKQFSLLKQLLSEFEQKGVEIVFFEMPIHEELSTLKRARKIRSEIQARFVGYPFLIPPQNFQIQTYDGEHLTMESAAKYANILRESLDKVNWHTERPFNTPLRL